MSSSPAPQVPQLPAEVPPTSELTANNATPSQDIHHPRVDLSPRESSKDATAPGPLPEVRAIDITPLWTPPPNVEVVADVVFVHGLKGHPFNTWLYGSVPNPGSPAKNVDGRAKKTSILSKLRPIKGPKKSAEREAQCYCYWPFDLLAKDFKNVRVLTYGYDSHPTHFY